MPAEGDSRCLATQTVNRLLRPLRTRCNVLAKMVSTQSRPATYSSSRRATISDPSNHDLPLAVYPPPDKFASKAHFSQNYRDSLELIRRIYAVRDAFRNVVIRAAGASQKSEGVPALSSLCALVIGQNMFGWEEPSEDEEEDSEPDATSFVDEMYESVPMACRGLLLSSHALGIILNTCPHHLTLISILLDETLPLHLEFEVTQLLEALLLVALRPKPNASAPICNAAHSKFLTEWLERWMSSGFAPAAFASVLIHVLSEIQNKDVWTCKAVEAVTRRLFNLDPTCFFWIVTGLARSLSKSRIQFHPDDGIGSMSSSICQWINFTLERLHALPQEQSQRISQSDALFEFIRTSWFSLASGTHSNLQDSVVCLSMEWLVHNRSHAPAGYVKNVESTLASFAPRPTTFRDFVKRMFDKHAIAGARQAIEAYISLLRRCQLHKLEASLCGSTLYVVENLEDDDRLGLPDRNEVRRFREQVMDLVDEAEAKLFKAPLEITNDMDGWSHREKRFSAISHSPWSKGGWEWEPVIGCWVRKQSIDLASPSAAIARKRRKISLATPMKKSRTGSWDSLAGGLWTQTPRPKLHTHRNTPRAGKLPALFPAKSLRFTSLVANAISQRTVLHPVNINNHRRASLDEDDLHSDDLNLNSSPVVVRYQKGERRRSFYEASNHEPSDDVLDFLASHPSSP